MVREGRTFRSFPSLLILPNKPVGQLDDTTPLGVYFIKEVIPLIRTIYHGSEC